MAARRPPAPKKKTPRSRASRAPLPPRPVVSRPPRTSPEEREARALALFAEIESSAGPAVRALAERAAAQTLEAFVRRMGHDYTNRLMGVRYGLGKLEKSLSLPEIDRAELLASVTSHREAVDRFQRVVERTREAVMLTPRHMCVEPFAPLVEEVRAAVVSALGDRAAKLDFTVDVEEGLTFHADHPFLLGALVDLVKNGAEAYPDTRPRNPVRLAARAHSRTVEIVVADDGYGWDPESLTYAFVPFSSGKPLSGTGLGLYLARRAIEEIHDGRITVESEGYTRGTTVRIVLPRRQKDVEPRRRLTKDEIFLEVERQRRADEAASVAAASRRKRA
jgi:signal transduction histidine kinase